MLQRFIDSTPLPDYISHKEKRNLFEFLEVNPKFSNFFASLLDEGPIDERMTEESVCVMYGFKSINDVNIAKHAKLLQMSGKINQLIVFWGGI